MKRASGLYLEADELLGHDTGDKIGVRRLIKSEHENSDPDLSMHFNLFT